MIKKVYVDIDGVLADWDYGVQNILGLTHITTENYFANSSLYSDLYYSSVFEYQKYGGRFWYDLPLLPDAKELWSIIIDHNPIILTAIGEDNYGAKNQKEQWIKKHFNYDNVICVKRSLEKHRYANSDAILIDDQKRVIDIWNKNNGIGILHKSGSMHLTKNALNVFLFKSDLFNRLKNKLHIHGMNISLLSAKKRNLLLEIIFNSIDEKNVHNFTKKFTLKALVFYDYCFGKIEEKDYETIERIKETVLRLRKRSDIDDMIKNYINNINKFFSRDEAEIIIDHIIEYNEIDLENYNLDFTKELLMMF